MRGVSAAEHIGLCAVSQKHGRDILAATAVVALLVSGDTWADAAMRPGLLADVAARCGPGALTTYVTYREALDLTADVRTLGFRMPPAWGEQVLVAAATFA